ncbi:MAG: hypothetical protein HY821_05445 [Acidobacteria bacterium]|nr:hypothetical protein [Acidobacteriota bacterium]
MEFLHGGGAKSVALLAGAWNPPTVAHVAMGRAALKWAERVVLAIPRALPHKAYAGVAFERRMEWIRKVAAGEEGFAAAVTEGGLFVEMAREARAAGAERVFLVCGRDAAERIVGWNYGVGAGIVEQMTEYELLVADRCGSYEAPAELAPRVHRMELGMDWEEVSSTLVRERIERSEEWTSLVPAAIGEDVARAFGAKIR